MQRNNNNNNTWTTLPPSPPLPLPQRTASIAGLVVTDSFHWLRVDDYCNIQNTSKNCPSTEKKRKTKITSQYTTVYLSVLWYILVYLLPFLQIFLQSLSLVHFQSLFLTPTAPRNIVEIYKQSHDNHMIITQHCTICTHTHTQTRNDIQYYL